jgi:hypothetical protein
MSSSSIAKYIGYIVFFEMVVYAIVTTQFLPLGYYIIWCICYFIFFFLFRKLTSSIFTKTPNFCDANQPTAESNGSTTSNTDGNQRTKILDKIKNSFSFLSNNFDIVFNINLTITTIVYIISSLYIYNSKNDANIINALTPSVALIIIGILMAYNINTCYGNVPWMLFEILVYIILAIGFSYFAYIISNGKSVFLNNMFVVNGEVCSVNKQQSMKCKIRSNN